MPLSATHSTMTPMTSPIKIQSATLKPNILLLPCKPAAQLTKRLSLRGKQSSSNSTFSFGKGVYVCLLPYLQINPYVIPGFTENAVMDSPAAPAD